MKLKAEIHPLPYLAPSVPAAKFTPLLLPVWNTTFQSLINRYTKFYRHSTVLFSKSRLQNIIDVCFCKRENGCSAFVSF